MNSQPVAIIGTLQAIITLAVAAFFRPTPGLDPSADTKVLVGAAIVALVNAALAALAHRLVTPVADPRDNNGTPLVPEL